MAYKMKGFSGFGNSPLAKKTNPQVPTHGPTDFVTGKDIETKEEIEARHNKYTYTPSVAEVLRKRKGEQPPPPPKDPIHKFLDNFLPGSKIKKIKAANIKYKANKEKK